MSRPFRFTFILVLAALGTGLAAVGGWRYARASAPVSGPIIVISIDTLRADHLPAYGYTKVKTPAIDALAADGAVFERAYSHAPQTLPAHASILSGRLPFETGVRDNVGFTVKTGERLLPQMLRERGFTTGGVVSAYVLRKETGISQGFDFFDGEMPPSSPELSIGQVQRDGGESEADRRALARYDRHLARVPVPASLRAAQAVRAAGSLRRTTRRTTARSPTPTRSSAAWCSYLKSHQLYDRSTIVLLSDHGEGLGRSRRAGARAVRLRRGDPRAAHHQAGRQRRRGPADRGPGAAHRSRADDSRSGESARRRQPARPLAQAGARRHRPPAAADDLFGGAVRALPLRLERADRAHRRALPLHQGAARRAVRPRSAIRTSATNIADDRPQPRQALRGALDRVAAGATIQTPADSLGRRARAAAGARLRRRADRRVDRRPARRCPIRKTSATFSSATATAVDFAGQRKWPQAIALLQQILHDDPEMADVWSQLAVFATRIDRYDLAVDAYKHYIELKPQEPTAYIGAAAGLLKLRKLDEAREHASSRPTSPPTTTIDRGRPRTRCSRRSRSPGTTPTRRATKRSWRTTADPTLPLPIYIDARLLYDQGKYADALPLFQQAIAELKKSGTLQIDELHFYTADTLARLERYPEAETEFIEELEVLPAEHPRARRAGHALPGERQARRGDRVLGRHAADHADA